MLSVLDELGALETWIAELRADIVRALRVSDSDAAALAAIGGIIERSTPPASIQAAIERDHFRRVQKRNVKSAERMRRVRQENPTEGSGI